jgi:hypothetical protein
MPEIDRFRIADALDSLRSSGLNVFGAELHGFHLNPVLTEAAVAGFERRHGVRLPSDYRSFLTSVGDGGAGPFYGVFPLGKVDDNFALRDWREADVGDLSEAFPFHEDWNDLAVKPTDELLQRDEPEYWRRMESFESTYWSTALVNGAFPICHQGCALRILLVATGDQAGYLWDDRRTEYAGIRRIRLEDSSPATFSGWYAEWLKRCVTTLNSPESAQS